MQQETFAHLTQKDSAYRNNSVGLKGQVFVGLFTTYLKLFQIIFDDCIHVVCLLLIYLSPQYHLPELRGRQSTQRPQREMSL